MTRYIEVRITRSGVVHAETHGLRGPECLAWVEPLKELLDADVAKSHYTEEFDLAPLDTKRDTTDEEWDLE